MFRTQLHSSSVKFIFLLMMNIDVSETFKNFTTLSMALLFFIEVLFCLCNWSNFKVLAFGSWIMLEDLHSFYYCVINRKQNR